MAINILPSGVIWKSDGGDANMATLATLTSQGRFDIGGGGFVLSTLRVHFNGGSGTADLNVYRQCFRTQPQGNMLLATLAARGVGADAYRDIPETEAKAYYIPPGDQLVLTWTNPNSPTMYWDAWVGLHPA